MRRPIHGPLCSVHRVLSSLAGGLLLACLIAPRPGWADELRLVTGAVAGQDPYAPFVRHLRALAGSTPPSPPSASSSSGDTPLAGVRLRSIPGSGRPAPAPLPPAAARTVTVAVGPAGARTALAESGGAPLLLAPLSRLEYEALRSHPALVQPRRPIAVLLREPDPGVQAALAQIVLGGQPRLGVVASADLEPLVESLRAAVPGHPLAVGYAADAAALASTLRDVLARTDALLILAERLGNDDAAGLTLLHAAAAAGKPAFATSEATVRAGALAAAYATPAQLAQQAMTLSRALAARTDGPSTRVTDVQVHHAWPVSVHVNRSVAQQLGLTLADNERLAAQLHGAPRSAAH